MVPLIAVCECLPERPGPDFPIRAALAKRCKREVREVCIIHDGSWRNHVAAKRDGRVESRGREASLKQDVDRLSGEPAHWHANDAWQCIAAADP